MFKKSFKLKGKNEKKFTLIIISKDTKNIVCEIKTKDTFTKLQKQQIRAMAQEWIDEFKTNKGKGLHFIDNSI